MQKQKMCWVIGFFLSALMMGSFCHAADLVLKWDASEGATGYKVQVGTLTIVGSEVVPVWGEIRDAGSSTTFTWTGASEDGFQLFRASAYNSQGEAIRYTAGAWYCKKCLPPVAPTGTGIE